MLHRNFLGLGKLWRLFSPDIGGRLLSSRTWLELGKMVAVTKLLSRLSSHFHGY